jgi:hypothetical protein
VTLKRQRTLADILPGTVNDLLTVKTAKVSRLYPPGSLPAYFDNKRQATRPRFPASRKRTRSVPDRATTNGTLRQLASISKSGLNCEKAGQEKRTKRSPKQPAREDSE